MPVPNRAILQHPNSAASLVMLSPKIPRKYIGYLRAVDGTIERVPSVTYNAEDDSIAPYVYEETLTDWPESKVFWVHETGPSTGIAPIAPDPSEKETTRP